LLSLPLSVLFVVIPQGSAVAPPISPQRKPVTEKEGGRQMLLKLSSFAEGGGSAFPPSARHKKTCQAPKITSPTKQKK
jgi:hypothetical protein